MLVFFLYYFNTNATVPKSYEIFLIEVRVALGFYILLNKERSVLR